MKFRTAQNSIRLRLRKSELHRLKTTGAIKEAVVFPNGIELSYALIINDEIESIKASMIDTDISIVLPADIASRWISSDQVSLAETIGLDDGNTLSILVEKDFPCKDRDEEDKDDTFWELVDGQGKAC